MSQLIVHLVGSVVELYWTAPELLRQISEPVNGTPKGDVYSFAIIMWELMYSSKAGPYHDINLEPKGRYGTSMGVLLPTTQMVCKLSSHLIRMGTLPLA